MNNRRKTNKRVAQKFFGTSALSVSYVPSKSDLLKLLETLRFKEPLKTRDARDTLNKARKARRKFERENKTWMHLRKIEKEAELELREIEYSEREQWKKEITECRNMLRMYGVTPEIINRIECLFQYEQ